MAASSRRRQWSGQMSRGRLTCSWRAPWRLRVRRPQRAGLLQLPQDAHERDERERQADQQVAHAAAHAASAAKRGARRSAIGTWTTAAATLSAIDSHHMRSYVPVAS